jgi:hypothetical protein
MQSNQAATIAPLVICPLEKLICGTATTTSTALEDEAVVVLRGLSKLVVSYYDFSLEYKQDLSKPQSSFFLPVALRSLMETAAIGLLARVDPLRVLLSSKSQNSTSYNKAMPQASALKWKGDIMGEPVKGQATAAAQGAAALPIGSSGSLWDPALSSAKLPRHLFSGQMCEAFWEPAAKNLANLQSANASTWIAEINRKAPTDLMKMLIGEGNQIYSELSKGIHPEFAVRRESEYDIPTLQTYLERTFKWIAAMGLLSHCSATFSVRLSAEEALKYVKEIEDAAK